MNFLLVSPLFLRNHYKLFELRLQVFLVLRFALWLIRCKIDINTLWLNSLIRCVLNFQFLVWKSLPGWELSISWLPIWIQVVAWGRFTIRFDRLLLMFLVSLRRVQLSWVLGFFWQSLRRSWVLNFLLESLRRGHWLFGYFVWIVLSHISWLLIYYFFLFWGWSS